MAWGPQCLNPALYASFRSNQLNGARKTAGFQSPLISLLRPLWRSIIDARPAKTQKTPQDIRRLLRLIDAASRFPTRGRPAPCGVRGQVRSMHRSLAFCWLITLHAHAYPTRTPPIQLPHPARPASVTASQQVSQLVAESFFLQQSHSPSVYFVFCRNLATTTTVVKRPDNKQPPTVFSDSLYANGVPGRQHLTDIANRVHHHHHHHHSKVNQVNRARSE